jgi:phosphomannomutase
MRKALARGRKAVCGWEANGGFLLNSDVRRSHRVLRALPTRDAVIVILSVLLLAKSRAVKISDLAASLPARFTASDRLKNFPTEQSTAILAQLNAGSEATDRQAIEKVFGVLSGHVSAIDRTDGLRVTFANDEVIHLRPSGNAPEFRCYSEAATDERARFLNAQALLILSSLSHDLKTDSSAPLP